MMIKDTITKGISITMANYTTTTNLAATNETTISAIPGSWEELYNLDLPIDFQTFLKSNLLATHRNFQKIIAIMLSVSGSVSFISSSAIIYHILRSHNGLSTTYHRLIFGLSVADIVSSCGFILSTIMTPKEMNYFTPFALGSVATCDIQGFIVSGGILCTTMYTSSLCFYYLSIIVFNKKDDYIRSKLEVWLHAVPILTTLTLGTSTALSQKHYNNPDAGVCFVTHNNPPHCIGYENGAIVNGFTIPCGRGDLSGKPFGTTVIMMGYAFSMVIAPVSIVGTMVSMYRSVSKIERKMQHYGVSSLRMSAQSASALRLSARASPSSPLRLSARQEGAAGTNLRQSSASQAGNPSLRLSGTAASAAGVGRDLHASTAQSVRASLRLNAQSSGDDGPSAADDGDERTRCRSLLDRITKSIMNCKDLGCNKKPTLAASRSNRAKSQKRAIMNMAMGYASAWAFIYIPYILYLLYPVKVTDLLTTLLNPLQGLFNLIVYLSPKVRSAKIPRRGATRNVSWRQAILKAWNSKGEVRRDRSLTSTRRSSSNLRTSQRLQNLMKSVSSRLSNQRSSLSKSGNHFSTTLTASDLAHLRSLDKQFSKKQSPPTGGVVVTGDGDLESTGPAGMSSGGLERKRNLAKRLSVSV